MGRNGLGSAEKKKVGGTQKAGAGLLKSRTQCGGRNLRRGTQATPSRDKFVAAARRDGENQSRARISRPGFPAFGGGMLALQEGYVFGDAHLPLVKYPLRGPPWDQVPGSPSMCSRGQRCAAGQSVPLDRWYSPYYRMRQRVSGRASDWTACPNCVALCWRRLPGNV